MTFIDVETNCPIMAVPRSELDVRLPALHAILGLVSGEDAYAAEVDSFVLAFTCVVSALDWDEVFDGALICALPSCSGSTACCSGLGRAVGESVRRTPAQ
jgi:hypothetical protein